MQVAPTMANKSAYASLVWHIEASRGLELLEILSGAEMLPHYR